MATKLDLKKDISFGKGMPKSKIPTKTSINLVGVRDGANAAKKSATTIIVISVIAALLIGVFVLWPVFRLASANAKVSQMRSELDAINAVLNSKKDIEEEYAHYTYDNMTEEEMTRVDRVQVMKLVEDSLAGNGNAKSWTVSGNIMTLQVTGSSLSALNQIAAKMEQSPIVDRCVINTANKGTGSDGTVSATFSVYLTQADESGEVVMQEEPETTEETANDTAAETEEGQEQ